MSIWFFLWILLSAALFYFMGWTMYILYRQKKTWREYARKYKLRYKEKGFMDSPEIGGTIDGKTVSVFVGEHLADDARRTRKLSAIEIQLSSKMPIEGGVANGGLVSIVQGMAFKEELRPQYRDWDNSYIASASHKHVLEQYLTERRLDVLTGLMKIKNVWIILVFKGDVLLLRMDTPSPLDNIKTLDAMIKKMLEAAKVLELEPGEEARLKSEAARKSVRKQALLDVDDGHLQAAAVGLELVEDDAPHEVVEVDAAPQAEPEADTDTEKS